MKLVERNRVYKGSATVTIRRTDGDGAVRVGAAALKLGDIAMPMWARHKSSDTEKSSLNLYFTDALYLEVQVGDTITIHAEDERGFVEMYSKGIERSSEIEEVFNQVWQIWAEHR